MTRVAQPPARTAIEGVDRLLKLPEVMSIAGLGKTMIYRRVRQGTFPQPVKLGESTRWSEREVREWLDAVMATRRAA